MEAGSRQKSRRGAGPGLLPGSPKGGRTTWGGTLRSFSRHSPANLGSNATAPGLVLLRGSHREPSLACPAPPIFLFSSSKGGYTPPPPPFPSSPASGLKPIRLLCKQSERRVWGRGLGGRGAGGARATAAPLGGRRGGWTGGRPPRRCTSGFVGASVFVRRTNGERTRRWALERRKIHISSTALVSQRPPAHFPRRRSRAPRSAAAACPRPPRRRARRAPQRRASSSLGWRWAGAGAWLAAAARLPAPRAARPPVA